MTKEITFDNLKTKIIKVSSVSDLPNFKIGKVYDGKFLWKPTDEDVPDMIVRGDGKDVLFFGKEVHEYFAHENGLSIR